jgi:hypothetical protein
MLKQMTDSEKYRNMAGAIGDSPIASQFAQSQIGVALRGYPSNVKSYSSAHKGCLDVRHR